MAGKLRAEALSTSTHVRLSPAEHSLIEAAALVNHQNVSQFARDALMSAAGECMEIPPKGNPPE